MRNVSEREKTKMLIKEEEKENRTEMPTDKEKGKIIKILELLTEITA